MKRFLLGLLVLAVPSLALGETPTAERVRKAVEKGLVRIEKGAAAYPTHRKCFSCHHQAMAMVSLTAARGRGFKVEKALVKKQVEFTLASYEKKLKTVEQGKSVAGGNTEAAYALWALETAGQKRDETTAALVAYLLARQKADGSWPAITKRPPTEG